MGNVTGKENDRCDGVLLWLLLIRTVNNKFHFRRNAAGIAVKGGEDFHTDEAFQAAELVTGGGVTSRIELSLSAQGLKNKDILSKSDPFAVVYLKGPKDADFIEVGRTEIVANNLDPTW